MSLGARDVSWLSIAVALAIGGCVVETGPVLGDAPNGPSPVGVAPLPSPDQLAWQTQELGAFVHFGMNTFTNKETSDGTDPATVFNPGSLDAGQWMTTLQNAGFRQAMLTAKPDDGFCLWPSRCTTYSVAASSWRGGAGDVVAEFVNAAHAANIRVGLALSPLDFHEPSSGTPAYQAFLECQLTELLTNYGAIDEIWLWRDPGAPDLDWAALHDLAHRLQPHTLVDVGNIAASTGADLRSVPGQPTDQTSVQPDPANSAGSPIWYPPEAVSSIRPSWYWHATEDTQVKTLSELMTTYVDSVGHNSLMRLDVPPNTQGLFADPDVAVLNQLGAALSDLYRTNVAAGRPVTADSVFDNAPVHAAAMIVDGKLDTYWAAAQGTTSARLEVDLGGEQTFNVVNLQEPIALGERTTEHHLEAEVNGVWTTIATGTTIGERQLYLVGTVTATRIALAITKTRGAPAIAEIGVYQYAVP
jgi:alpha-L-fucosidase